MLLRVLGWCLTLLAGLGVAVTTVAPAHASPASTYARSAVHWTNEHRADHDRAALRHSDCLQRKAHAQARAMAKAGEMSHQDLYDVMDDCGLNTAGENVAVGYASGKAVVNDGWMHSAGHRRNILRRTFHLVAVAAVKDDDGVWWTAQVFGRKA